jgi:2-phosphosulfolactate phosphatase
MRESAVGGFEPWPDSSVHVSWGTVGAALAAERGDVVVAVDVLSLSTTLSIAVARDFTCLIYSRDELEELGGPAFAGIRLGARPLLTRAHIVPEAPSLSPSSLLVADPGQRVVVASDDGAALVAAAAKAPALLIGGLRNATACARTAARLLGATRAGRVTVVGVGGRWDSPVGDAGELHPCVEDWIGAGAICAGLAELGYSLSAEARLAAAGLASETVLEDLADCVSARELRDAGYAADVELALQVDADETVPVRMTGEQTGRVFLGVPPAAVDEG